MLTKLSQSLRLILVGLLIVSLTVAATPGLAQQEASEKVTITRISISETGDAQWALEIRTPLETDADVEAFEQYQEDIATNTSTYLTPVRDRITTLVGTAETETGREMAVQSFAVETTIQTVPRQWGVVTYTFEWENFAAEQGEELVIADVFGGGYYLSSTDSLVISSPDGYVATAAPTPDEQTDGTVTYEGPTDFAGSGPAVTFAPAGSGGVTDAGAGPTALILLFGLLIIAVLAVLGYKQLSSTEEPPENNVGEMTDGEKVLALLKENNGRVKQNSLGEEFGWSSSKVSRVVNKLDEEEKVKKLRLGRENLVQLFDEDDEL